MSVAMMLPTVTRPMMRAAEGSPDRAWAFIVGFLAAWPAAGANQILTLQHRLIRSCSAVPFAGRALRYGARQGLRCVASCAPIMLAAMVTAMALPGFVAPVVVLLGITVLLCWEREPSTRRQAIAVVGTVMMLAAVGGVMLLGSGAGHLHG